MAFYNKNQLLLLRPATAHMLAESDFVGDKTEPTDEILNTLKALNNSSNSVKSEPQLDNLLPGSSSSARPASEYDVLTAQLKEKPHSPEGWRRLIDIAEQSGDIEKIRAAFDALLQTYPNTVC